MTSFVYAGGSTGASGDGKDVMIGSSSGLKVHFKFGKSSHDFVCGNVVKLENLRDVVMKKWKEFYTKEFHFEHDEIAIYEDSQCELIDASK